MKEVVLQIEHLYKEFGATKAVTDVTMELYRGEVRGLIGENGSGKSTISNIITGAFAPTKGTMCYKGEPYSPQSVLDAKKKGIVLLAQELGTIHDLTVAENMFLGEESQFSKVGAVSVRRLEEEARKILEENNVKGVDTAQPAASYSFEVRKMIEVARALHEQLEILIVDETTAALSQSGRERIYEVIEEQKKLGRSVIFISHDLDEVKRVCDSVTILRDGQYIDTLEKESIEAGRMRNLMVGRELAGDYYRADTKATYEDEMLLKVDNVSLEGVLDEISLELHKGEILGIGGLTECGMHELCKVIFGAVKATSGSVVLTREGVKITSPEKAISHKVAYIPKDRDQESLFQATSIQDNIVSASLKKLMRGIFVWPGSEKRLASDMAEKMSVKMQNVSQLVSDLSGGNKQKVAIAKWLANDSEILIMDCPTRGIDVGVKANIYRLMEQLKTEGKAIIMVSEELEELLGMSDRILVLKDGKLAGEFMRSPELDRYAVVEKMI